MERLLWQCDISWHGLHWCSPVVIHEVMHFLFCFGFLYQCFILQETGLKCYSDTFNQIVEKPVEPSHCHDIKNTNMTANSIAKIFLYSVKKKCFWVNCNTKSYFIVENVSRRFPLAILFLFVLSTIITSSGKTLESHRSHLKNYHSRRYKTETIF